MMGAIVESVNLRILIGKEPVKPLMDPPEVMFCEVAAGDS
jgi:hypothetical protein